MTQNELKNFQVEYTIFFKPEKQQTEQNGNFFYHGNPSAKEDVLFALDQQVAEVDWSAAHKVTFTIYEVTHSHERVVKHAGELTESEITQLLASAPE